MPQKSIRAVGASVILVGVAVAAILQVGPRGDRSAVALTPERLVTTTSEVAATDSEPVEPTTTTTIPFTYRMGVLAGISTDNFWAFYGTQPSVWNSYVLGPTKPALFKVDPLTSELVPELARSAADPSQESGRWVVELELRDDMAWSDGEPVTAGDVAFTFRTVRSLELGGSWATAFPETVASMEAISEHMLRIEFVNRPSIGVWPDAVGTAPIMAEHVWADDVAGAQSAELYAAPGADDVYGGPLALVEVTEELIVSVYNPGYPLDSTPNTVEYHVYEDEASAVEALIDAEIDAILSPKGLSAESRRLAEVEESITIDISPANGVRYLGFNLERRPMSDAEFRKALALVLDREGLVGAVGDGSQVAYSFVRDSNALWYDDAEASSVRDLYAGDLEVRLDKAINGLRAGGYAWETEPQIAPDGSVTPGIGLTIDGLPPAPLTILTAGDSYDPARPEYVAEIANALGLFGFDVRPVVTDFDTVVDLTFSEPGDGPRQYDMYFLGWTLGNPSLPDYYRPLFAADGVMNNTGYQNPEFDQLLASYESSTSIEEARERLWAMEQTLAEDLPYLLLYTTEIAEAYRSDRVTFGIGESIGGIQGRLGGIGDVNQP